jgi:hypothetical protein
MAPTTPLTETQKAMVALTGATAVSAGAANKTATDLHMEEDPPTPTSYVMTNAVNSTAGDPYGGLFAIPRELATTNERAHTPDKNRKKNKQKRKASRAARRRNRK